jgi:hypothetical protein
MLSSVFGVRAVPEASEFILLKNTWDLGSKSQNMRFLKGLLPGGSHGGIFHEEEGMNVLLPIYFNRLLHLALL